MKGYNEFSKKLMREFIKKNGSENIVFSPYSVAILLGMAVEAASGKTRDELVNFLVPNGTYEDSVSMASELMSAVAGEKSVKSSNAALVKKEIGDSILPAFVSTMKKKFGGEVIIAETLIEEANKWASKKTDGMIPQIMDDSMNYIMACLANAVLFKARWKEKYEPHDIEDDCEFENSDCTLSLATMLMSEERNCIEDEWFDGFARPYKNGFSYMALLPKEKGVRFMNKAIEEADFGKLYESIQRGKVSVGIPEYTAEFGADLEDMLKENGVELPFSDNADFSNMSDFPLKIDSIVHKAKIEVDRKGTRAAAVTEMCFEGACLPVEKRIILDRPFVYAIVHNKTGIPLFIGTVNNLPNKPNE